MDLKIFEKTCGLCLQKFGLKSRDILRGQKACNACRSYFSEELDLSYSKLKDLRRDLDRKSNDFGTIEGGERIEILGGQLNVDWPREKIIIEISNLKEAFYFKDILGYEVFEREREVSEDFKVFKDLGIKLFIDSEDYRERQIFIFKDDYLTSCSVLYALKEKRLKDLVSIFKSIEEG